MLNRISLTWIHYPRSEIFAVQAHGLSCPQLRHYAVKVGFHDFTDDEGDPVLVGARSSKNDLLCLLKSAGYDIADEQVRIDREDFQ